MAAKPSALHETKGFNDLVEARIAEIQRLADVGDWEKIESVVRGLPGLVGRIPESERHAILLATRDCIESIRAQAVERSEEIGAKLATLHTGRRAAESYRANGVLNALT